MSKMRLLLFGLMCLFGFGSFSACVPLTPSECRAFLNLPGEQRHAEFRGYQIDKQLDVYLCVMRAEAPDLALADDIAARGSEVIPFVLAKLRSAKSEVDQADLIYLLEVISDRGYLRGRKDVVSEVSNVIDSMKISQTRQTSLESLRKIQINSGIKPFTYIQ
jgi:hypothetical protein